MPLLTAGGRGDSVDLYYEAEGSGGLPVVLLHGLAGHSGEWELTARSLLPGYSSVRLDQRAHGRSTGHPADLSREVFADDAAAVITHCFGRQRVTLVGQSMGAHTALLTASRHPGLVSHLIMVEGDIGGGGDEPLDQVREAIQSWPLSFASHASVMEFFGGDNAAGRAWAAGYAERGGRCYPRFDPQNVAPIMAPVFGQERWDAWASLAIPVDLVLAERSIIDSSRIDRMVESRPETGRYVITGAGHDLHLEQPASWVELLRTLLPASR